MDEQDIQIWDDIYPCEFFEEDIKKGYQELIKRYRNVFFNELENKFIKSNLQKKSKM